MVRIRMTPTPPDTERERKLREVYGNQTFAQDLAHMAMDCPDPELRLRLMAAALAEAEKE